MRLLASSSLGLGRAPSLEGRSHLRESSWLRLYRSGRRGDCRAGLLLRRRHGRESRRLGHLRLKLRQLLRLLRRLVLLLLLELLLELRRNRRHRRGARRRELLLRRRRLSLSREAGVLLLQRLRHRLVARRLGLQRISRELLLQWLLSIARGLRRKGARLLLLLAGAEIVKGAAILLLRLCPRTWTVASQEGVRIGIHGGRGRMTARKVVGVGCWPQEVHQTGAVHRGTRELRRARTRDASKGESESSSDKSQRRKK